MNEIKIRKSGADARQALRNGVNEVGDTIRATLGPNGRNVIFDVQHRGPEITNDGVSIAQQFKLEDPFEDIGAQTVIEASLRTDEQVQDGTTTSMVLAQRIINDSFDKIDQGVTEGKIYVKGEEKVNVMALKREIHKSKDVVIEHLKKSAKEIKTLDEIKNVATSSVESKEIGKSIGEMMHKIGVDGDVTVEERVLGETGYEVLEGLKIDARFVAPQFVNTSNKEAIWHNAHILVTNQLIDNINQIQPIITKLGNQKITRLVILAERYDQNVIGSLVNVTLTTPMKVLPLFCLVLSSINSFLY